MVLFSFSSRSALFKIEIAKVNKYIDDDVHLTKFAYDLKIVFKIDPLQPELCYAKIFTTLTQLSINLDKLGLCINPGKTKAMKIRMSTSYVQRIIFYDHPKQTCSEICLSKEARDLGVIVQSNLRFNMHIDNMDEMGSKHF